MKLAGPERYSLKCDAKSFAIASDGGVPKFSRLACSRVPKLYVVSAEGKPIYVGVTKQPMRSRLRLGFMADGRNGYHGYAWRRTLTEATLGIWFQEDSQNGSLEDIETVEAEVVFLARSSGQWPLYQTEIHFHQSNENHRSVAAEIWQVLATGT